MKNKKKRIIGIVFMAFKFQKLGFCRLYKEFFQQKHEKIGEDIFFKFEQNGTKMKSTHPLFIEICGEKFWFSDIDIELHRYRLHFILYTVRNHITKNRFH